MNNFNYYVPTKIWFGKGQISHLTELSESGKRVLLVYGGGSIKKLGIYDEATAILKGAGLEVFELCGVEPNPRVEKAREGIEICRANDIDMLLTIGGGSVIDTAKSIAAGVCYDGDVWDLIEDSSKIKAAKPVYTVLTLSATGSEMNKNAVLSDLSRGKKASMSSDLLKPRMSICDPTYTFTVSRRQTAAGTADMISHTFENYFSPIRDSYLSSRFSEALLRTCIKYGPIALAEPDNYEARANLMWASTNAINGIAKVGAEVGWCCHPIEHELSAYYDVTHGEGLAIIIPRWMRHILSEATAWKFAEYGRNVWELEGGDMEVAEAAIAKTEEFFFDVLGLPRTLGEVGIDDKKIDLMASNAAPSLKNAFVPLDKDDVAAILRACL
ncbi:MAG: iron-containing alcohol dehydrogenase [Oscillospiraceae bacterium]|nr:iron-containing alcohol dehydrogenase [Oscillospiraceae bacterium]